MGRVVGGGGGSEHGWVGDIMRERIGGLDSARCRHSSRRNVA